MSIELDMLKNFPFLQGFSVASYSEPCITYGQVVWLSVYLSHTDVALPEQVIAVCLTD